MRIDSNALGIGTEIDLERDLGLNDNSTIFNGVLGYRFADRWHLEAEYFNVGRKSTQFIDQDITIDGTVFPIDAELPARFDSNVFRLSVGWSAFMREKTRFNLSVGFHITDFLLRFEGEGRVGDGDLSGAAVGSRSLLAPLPTIGIYATHSFTDYVSVTARGDFFSLNVGDYDGTLINARIGANYRFHRNWGVGAGWRLVSYDVGIDRANDRTRIDYRFSGPYIVLEAGF